MTIFCKICGHSIRSGRPPGDAQRHVLEQMSTHLAVHQEQAVSLAQLITTSTQLLATYLLIKKYVRIPPEEKDLLDSFDVNEGALIDLFALEPEAKETSN